LSAPKNSKSKSSGGFMGKKWDYDVPSIEIFKEMYRVLKPGGTMLCFAGSRTQHRMACNI
jgi:site-specific DNA-methyltransferase (adenine-specific)